MAQKRWMPNRMFDPSSNPFAIQNLLEKQAPPFIPAHDERTSQAFGADTVLGGSIIKAFEVDPRLLMPEQDETTSAEFSAEPRAAAAGFTPDAAAAAHEARAASAEPEAAAQAPDQAPVSVSASASAEVDDRADTQAEAHASSNPAVVEASAPAIEPAAAGAMAQLDHDDSPASIAEAASASVPAIDSAALDELLEAARKDAYAQGLEAGIAQGRDAERPVAHRDGYDEGYLAGLTQARAELQAEREQELQQAQQQQHDAQQAMLERLQTVIAGLQQLSTDPDALFEPMKRLAVHLAEQLVRSELSQSPQAISRLVDNALRELNATGDKPVVVHLNPDDLELYRPTVAQFSDSLVLRPDKLLERGSVRASLDGSVVEDMIQRRIAGLKSSLAQPAAPGWRSAGGKLSDRLADGERGSRQVEDVTPVEHDERLTETAPAEGDA